MAELLAALAIIGILAAAASPVFVQTMRDGRVSSAANQIAELYRTARSRALGRGACVWVRWDENHALPTLTDPEGRFTMREAIASLGGTCASPLPSTSCINTDWTSGAESKFVAAFDDQAPQFDPAEASVFTVDAAGNETEQTDVEVVFSPRGRTFIRIGGPGGSIAPLRGVLRIEVENTQTTFTRQVVIPPNGAARVVGRM